MSPENYLYSIICVILGALFILLIFLFPPSDSDELTSIPDKAHYVKTVMVDDRKCVIFRDANVGGIDCEN